MARYNDGHRVVSIRGTNRAKAARRVHMVGKFGVGPRFSIGDFEKSVPAAELEVRPAQVERKRELFASSREVLRQLGFPETQSFRRGNPVMIGEGTDIREIVAKAEHGKPLLGHAEQERPNGRLGDGVVERWHRECAQV